MWSLSLEKNYPNHEDLQHVASMHTGAYQAMPQSLENAYKQYDVPTRKQPKPDYAIYSQTQLTADAIKYAVCDVVGLESIVSKHKATGAYEATITMGMFDYRTNDDRTKDVTWCKDIPQTMTFEALSDLVAKEKGTEYVICDLGSSPEYM